MGFSGINPEAIPMT